MDSVEESVSHDDVSTRTRKLTKKGEEAYSQRKEKYSEDIERLWTVCNAMLLETDNPPTEVRKCLELEHNVVQSYSRYHQLNDEYLKFLEAQRTDLATQDIEVIAPVADIRQRMYETAIAALRETWRNSPARSSLTKSSRSEASSRTSSASSLARRTRARAEAAKAAAAFAEKQALISKREAELQETVEREASRKKAEIEQDSAIATRKKAELKAEMTLLETQKQVAALEAEARILEAENDLELDLDHLLPAQDENPFERVKDFVDRHSSGSETRHTEAEAMSHQPRASGATNDPVYTESGKLANGQEPQSNTAKTVTFDRQRKQSSHSPIEDFGLPSTSSPFNKGGLNPVDANGTLGYSELDVCAPIFVPGQAQRPYQPSSSRFASPSTTAQDHDTASAITKFLLRKDLVFSRLSTFNDRAESYHVWKSSFESVVEELAVSDSEQLDLLVKWLGTDSARHAVSIRASNAENPTKGLQRLWQRLDERYGCPEMIEASLKAKLADFPRLTNKDNKRLYELSDILYEIEYIKEKPQLRNHLAYFDSSSGIKPIVAKLPYGLQERWTTRAVRYNSQNSTSFPPFTEFSAFIREMSRIKNNPGFTYDTEPVPTQNRSTAWPMSQPRTRVGVHKIEASQPTQRSGDKLDRCILHNTKHSLDECRGFRSKSLEERKKLLQDHKVCFKCCESTKHVSRDCKAFVTCRECGSNQHSTALHVNRSSVSTIPQLTTRPVQHQGGEPEDSYKSPTVNAVNASCTEVCNDYEGKSCAKILPVNVFHEEHPGNVRRMYAIIDDQSNRSLAAPEFFELFGVRDKPETYTLSTCSGKVITSGRRGKGFIIESVHGSETLDLPVLIECENIPNNRNEIPTPDIAARHPHLAEIAKQLSPLDDCCNVLLLIGRDLPEAHHVRDQRLGPSRALYAQQLKLGWVVVGETCLDKQHAPNEISVNRTYVTASGRPTVFEPCENSFNVRELPLREDDSTYVGQDIFVRTPDDNKPGMSYDDKRFMRQMETEFVRDATGSWVAPLPFRTPRPLLPNNREQAVRRAKMLDTSLKKNSTKKGHFVEFMGKILDNNHAEVAPPLLEGEECWYLPLFGVYHPKKPDQIRGVFDSSAKFRGISLNNVLLTGPDLSNSLLGVLMRFRKETVAVTADVQHMFHCFIVREDHRNYLRFWWYRDNNPDKELIEYRMRVHVFGNSPSPAVATLGLRKAAQESEAKYGSHVTEFVANDFYVDDGLTSRPTVIDAVTIMKDTQNALREFGNLRLHKFASNSAEVMSAFPPGDLASNLKDLDLDADNKPLQRSLGLIWDVNTDNFLFQLTSEKKPVTRRGMLSTINSIYDPLGFLAPVLIHGKLLLRNLVSETVDWDQPFSDEIAAEWDNWRDSLRAIENLRIPRTYVTKLSGAVRRELHVFSDASEKAIAAVVYLRTVDKAANHKLGFAGQSESCTHQRPHHP
ncbi:uncharacterized protein LOC141914773 [Tubulanus polymorphus]|uniref:uncharacterized protein LOC141914773 n=1 Tax=Tubulanus polymorphus TaxID=672921 RepID=UPI003DA1F659